MNITIRAREFELKLPALDLREDLVYSYGAKWKSNRSGVPLQRVCAAMLALCIPEVAFGIRSLANPRDDLYSYGADIYNALREKGWTPSDILSAGNDVVGILNRETFPTKGEVEKARGKSESGEPSEKPSA